MPRFLLLLIIPFLLSCGTGTQQQKKQSLRIATADTGAWYRRYTGTVAGQAVVVNLFTWGKGEIRGTYYYVSKGIILDLNKDTDSSSGSRLFLYESVSTERTVEYDYHDCPHWQVSITGDQLAGKWISRDGRTRHEIVLKEDYSGAYRFQVVQHDSTITIRKNGLDVNATASFDLTLPIGGVDDADFIEKTLINEVGGGGKKEDYLIDNFLSGDNAFFKEYRETLDSADDIDSSSLMTYHYERTNTLSVIYNDNGIVDFELLSTYYTGGAHGMYGSSFVCIDVKQHRVWRLGDIMKMDTPALRGIIEKAVRKEFAIGPDESFGDRLLVDTIPVTGNIYFTHTGIVFSYTPYEVASYAEGQVSFFVPWPDLAAFLTPDFKKRMNL